MPGNATHLLQCCLPRQAARESETNAVAQGNREPAAAASSRARQKHQTELTVAVLVLCRCSAHMTLRGVGGVVCGWSPTTAARLPRRHRRPQSRGTYKERKGLLELRNLFFGKRVRLFGKELALCGFLAMSPGRATVKGRWLEASREGEVRVVGDSGAATTSRRLDTCSPCLVFFWVGLVLAARKGG